MTNGITQIEKKLSNKKEKKAEEKFPNFELREDFFFLVNELREDKIN